MSLQDLNNLAFLDTGDVNLVVSMSGSHPVSIRTEDHEERGSD